MIKTSTRANILIRRTYSRPKNEEETSFESWEDIVNRVIDHQHWLWERAKKKPLDASEHKELEEFKQLMLDRKVSTSGRTLWLGGTDIAKKREASQFNCSFTEVETVYDVVDVLWLLMQGCGVGFKPVTGTLNGFLHPIPTIDVVHTTREEKGGKDYNEESFDEETKTWTISVGDSAEAWAKSIGKLLAGKYPADRLILDFSELRPAGTRLKGYGWISSGDSAISKAYVAIAKIMNKRAGQLLTKIDILDLVNWLGTILSSRRSAEIALFDYGEPEWKEFAVAKREWWINNPQRVQSNNSLLFRSKPSREELEHIFDLMVESGGSEPGFVNAETALKRAPWFRGSNPCCEILLGNKTFCNLVEVDIGKFHGDTTGLHRALELSARANYRQTCVNLKDDILQESWHLNNEFLRLCGVGLTGIARRPDLQEYDYQQMQRIATMSAYAMADELGTQRPKNVTTVKPSGTLSKIMDTTEGIHKPLGRYVFNNVNFGKNDPLLPKLREAGYKTMVNPADEEGVIVTFPVDNSEVEFSQVHKVIDGKEVVIEVNLESAVEQLERYGMVQDNYCQQNVSNTISYSPEEIPDIITWLLENWNIYVGVSFLYRADPTKTAADLGYLYLPQEVVTKEVFEAYASTLQHIELDEDDDGFVEIENQECVGGACPVK
jgi:ribonucleoside-triphosphate reductase